MLGLAGQVDLYLVFTLLNVAWSAEHTMNK